VITWGRDEGGENQDVLFQTDPIIVEGGGEGFKQTVGQNLTRKEKRTIKCKEQRNQKTPIVLTKEGNAKNPSEKERKTIPQDFGRTIRNNTPPAKKGQTKKN